MRLSHERPPSNQIRPRTATQTDSTCPATALESTVRYLAAELGPKGIRVHAISPGPLETRAASGITDFDKLLDKARGKAPARRLVSIHDVGVATAFLAHDAARLITGETLYVDGGYHIVD
jgi:enoyl-[acyl-carrier protein] reductase I